MGRKINDLTGQRFGELKVVEEAGRSSCGNILWLCQCDCGEQTVIITSNLRKGDTSSCGNWSNEYHLRQRFLDKVEINEDCWEWVGCKSSNRYGTISYAGSPVRATHVSWYLHHGEWPSDLGLYVLHHCDNPSCVNPDHLFLGTHQDNMADMVEKGRGRPARVVGENNGRSKLTRDQVLKIRRMYATGAYTQTELAKLFPVSQRVISDIVNRQLWTHI